MSSLDGGFAQCVALRVQRERCKEIRRERNHSNHRLTWVMSQQDTDEDMTNNNNNNNSQQEGHAAASRLSALTDNNEGEAEDGDDDEEVTRISHQLQLLVSSWSLDELQLLIEDNCGKPDFVLFIKSVFECSKPKTRQGLDRFVVAFHTACQMLAHGSITSSSSTTTTPAVSRRADVAGELLQQTKLLPDRSLALVTEKTLNIVLSEHNNQFELQEVLEILCKLVNSLAHFPTGALDPDERCSANLALQDMDGRAFKFLVVRQLCSSKTITDRTLPPLLVALKDLCLNIGVSGGGAAGTGTGGGAGGGNSAGDDAKMCQLLFDRLERNSCAWLKRVRLSPELGKISLHFFALSRFFSSKDRGCGAILMEDFFEPQADQQQPPPPRVSLPVFGQVLMNFSLVCAQDAELGKAFLKELESRPPAQFNKTALAFLLSLSRVKRFEEQCFDLFLQKSKTATLLEAHLVQLCDDIAQCKTGSWDLLLPSLVKASTKLADAETVLLPHPNLDLAVTGAGGMVGVRVLAHCFKVHALCRMDLLNEVFKRSLCSPVQQVLPFARLLFVLMRDDACARSVLMDYTQFAKDLLSILPNCQPRVAYGLLRALFAPASSSSSSGRRSNISRELRDVRDHAMVVFRKTLFVREARPRFVALFGVLCLYRQQQGLHGGGDEEHGEEDALNCLKRCLSQQCEIRNALYSGLLALPSTCAELIVLGSHFRHVLVEKRGDNHGGEGKEDVSPLHIQACVDPVSGRITEPLAGLLQCAIHGGFDATDLIRRFTSGSLAAFSLDKSCSFDACVTGGAANRSTAILVIECCEVLMNHLVERGQGAEDGIAKLWRLQRAVRRLVAGSTTPALSSFASGNKRTKKTTTAGGRKAKTTAAAAAAKKKKKTAAGEDEDDDDAFDNGGEAEENDDELGGGGGGSGGVDAPMPDEGAWLSDRTLLILFAQSQQVSQESMMDVAPTNGNHLSALQTRTGFHTYLLNCIKLRLRVVSQLCQTVPAPHAPFAKHHNSSSVAAANGEEPYFRDMARSCAGAPEMDITAFCTGLGPLLLRAPSRYERLQQLAGATAGATSAAATAAAAAEEPQQKKTKKRKSNASAAAAAASTTTTSTVSATPEQEASALHEQAVDCLKDLITCLSKTQREFEVVVQRTFAANNNNNKANVFHLAGIQLFALASRLFEQTRLSSAFAAFDMYCLVVQRAVATTGSSSAGADNDDDDDEDDQQVADAVVAHHLSLCKQLLSSVVLKSGPHVKQVVKFYLELNTRHCKHDLSLIFSELAARIARPGGGDGHEEEGGEEDDDDLRMVTHSRLPALQVVVASMTHAMDELESTFTQPDAWRETALQLEHVAQLYAQFFAQSREPNAAAAAEVTVFQLDAELLLKAVIKYYKQLAKFFKALIASKRVVPCAGDVGRLVQNVSRSLSTVVEERIRHVQGSSSSSSSEVVASSSSAGGKKPTRKAAGAGKKNASAKLVPEVVFALEQYEVTLLKASKSCAGGSLSALERYVRRTMARDFKVDSVKLKTALEEEAEEEDDDDDDADGRKRQRRRAGSRDEDAEEEDAGDDGSVIVDDDDDQQEEEEEEEEEED